MRSARRSNRRQITPVKLLWGREQHHKMEKRCGDHWVEFNPNSSSFLITRNERTGLTGRPVHPRRSLVNCLFYHFRSEGLQLREWCAGTSPLHSDLRISALSKGTSGASRYECIWRNSSAAGNKRCAMTVWQRQRCGGRLGISHVCALSLFATQYELSELFCLLGEQKLCKLPESLDLTVVSLYTASLQLPRISPLRRASCCSPPQLQNKRSCLAVMSSPLSPPAGHSQAGYI